MNVIFSSKAARDFENQIAYLLEQGAVDAAARLRQRVLAFIDNFLARYPMAGRHVEERDVFEVWIPQTQYVLVYRIEERDIRILALFHAAQDRTRSDT